MFCKKCGAQLENDDPFCGECGAKFENLKNDQVEQAVSPQMAEEPEQKSKSKKKNKIGLVISIVTILAVLLAGGIFAYINYLSPEAKYEKYLELGQKYLSEENYKEAIIAFKKAIEIDGKRSEAYAGLVEAYEESGDIEKAMEILEKGYRETEDEDLLGKQEDLQDVDVDGNDSGNPSQSEKTDESQAAEDTQWKDAFIDYIYGVAEDDEYSMWTFQLIYLDADNIPELMQIAGGEYGMKICVYHDGIATPTQLERWGYYYYEKGNKLCNSTGCMGGYCDVVYEMKAGELTKIAEGEYNETLTSEGAPEVDESGDVVYQYKWNGRLVSKEVYYDRLGSIFDTKKAVVGSDEGCSAEEMISIIEAY